MEILMFYVTHSDRASAAVLCDRLVEERLIACYNLMDIEACYWWKGTVEKEGEVVTILKTAPELETEVENRIRELHPYETPCMIRWGVSANRAYAEWIRQSTDKSDK